MRHLVIGTAGHVDHGKTALVHALTGVMTDRLPEEQRRGITIELGFAPWRIDDDLLVSVIDAPGHRRLVHHMIAGASGIDIILLVVAADEGVMPQTREHIAACKLLGLKRAVVAITKIDRVERTLGELAAEEGQELLAAEGISNEAVLCSAKTGEGVEAVAAAMRRAIEQTGEGVECGERVRLGVDRVFTVKGAGTVVTGTLVSGSLAAGAALRVLGADGEQTSTARALHVHGEVREQVAAPTRLAINLGGLSVDEVSRGDVITDDPNARPSRVLDVWLQLVAPIRRGAQASIHLGTARSTARIQPAERTDRLECGGPARLRLTAPLVAVGGDRFVLRGARVDGPAGAVLGGGGVLDAHPPGRVRAAKRVALLEALQRGDGTQAARLLVAEQGPRALCAALLPSRFAIAAAVLARAADALAGDGALVTIEGHGWLTAEHLRGLVARALELVAEHHRRAPLEAGLKLPTLREQLAAVAGEHATAHALGMMTHGPEPALVVEGEHVRLPSFRGAVDDAAAARALESARALLRDRALHGASEHAVVEQLAVDAKQARTVLAAVVRQGAAVRAGGLWFAADAVEALRRQVEAHFSKHERLTIQQLKEMTGLGRKQTIPLLEHFDQTGLTRRQGSARVRGR